MRLLVLDDDAAVGRLVSRVARICGFEPGALTDPSDLIATLERDAPDVVVLDLQLGRHDAVEQLHVLSERQFAGSVILISGLNQRLLAATRALGEDLGLRVEAALNKPLEVSVLEDVLQRLSPTRTFVSAERVLAAIQNNELSLALQPIVSCPLKNLSKLEVLVRWDHPAHGTLSAAAFVPVAETEDDVADALTEWVVRAAMDAYQVLCAVGIDVPLAVNLSANNLLDPRLPDRITNILQAGAMPPERLWLEISQASPLQDAAEAARQLTRLRLKKMNVSLADFGARYSSLNLLRKIPFSEMKIDRSLISDIENSQDARVIVGSIIELARKMEMDTVATGVETEEAAAALEALGIGAIQGRLIAQPMPVELVQSWLNDWNGDAPAPVLPPEEPRPMRDMGLLKAMAPPADGAEAEAGRKDADSEERRTTLSGRQLDVLRLLAEGKSAKDIARTLGLSIGTVKVHLSRAYATLGVHNRVEAIIKAGYLDQSSRPAPPGGRLH